YQYWLNTDDRDAVRFLKYFTFLSFESIAELEEKLRDQPEQREAQKVLAYEMTLLVHNASEADSAVKTSLALFGGSLEGLNEKQLNEISADMPTTAVDAERFG